MQSTLLNCVRRAGQILLDHCERPGEVRQKENQSSIVTHADLAAEQCIADLIRSRFPGHSLLAEETGFAQRPSEFTWVIDPLDGTSNFAAGLPWFGVQIAVLQHNQPILAAMFLPAMDALYFAEKGKGVQRNGQPVHVTDEKDSRNVLCAFGLDAADSEIQSRQQAEWLVRVANRVRNVRATNCLLDFGYTLDGRFGGVVNLNTKIWDIAPAALMLPEAGGRLTNLAGDDIVFQPGTEPFDRSYAIVGASHILQPQLLAALR